MPDNPNSRSLSVRLSAHAEVLSLALAFGFAMPEGLLPEGL